MIAAVLISVVSCGSRESAVKDTAQKFLDAFFKADFDSAAKLCTPALVAGKFDSLKAPMAGLDSAAKEIFLKQLSTMKPEVLSVEKRHGKDSVDVKYKITVPEGQSKEITNTLTVVKDGDIWKVAKFAE